MLTPCGSLEARGGSGARPPDIDPPVIRRRMRSKREVFQRFGLTAHCQEIEKEPEGASNDARDRERIKRARSEPET